MREMHNDEIASDVQKASLCLTRLVLDVDFTIRAGFLKCIHDQYNCRRPQQRKEVLYAGPIQRAMPRNGTVDKEPCKQSTRAGYCSDQVRQNAIKGTQIVLLLLVPVSFSNAHYGGRSFEIIADASFNTLLAQNFLVSIFESQFGRMMTLGNGSTTHLGELTDKLNMAFSFVFIIELLINLVGHWPDAFIHNAWVANPL